MCRGECRHLRMPLVPGVRNAVQENDRLTRACLHVVPRQIFRVAWCSNKVVGKGDAVDYLGITLLISLTRFDMGKMPHTLLDTFLVGNESLDGLAAAFRYFGVLMWTF